MSTYIAVGVFVVALISWAIYATHAKKSIRRRLENRFAGENILIIEDRAQFLGFGDKGRRQPMPQGVWILTQMRIYFEPYAYKKLTYDLPIEKLLSVRLEKKYMDVTIIGHPAVVTVFADDSGNEAECGWKFDDFKQVIGKLQELTEK